MKAPPLTGFPFNLDKEIEFYRKIVPAIQSLLRELNEDDKVVPRVHGICALNSAILLEDMTSHGYKIVPVQHGYNLEETKAILKKMASIHAAGAVLQEREPDIFENFHEGKNLNTSGKTQLNWRIFQVF